MYGFPKKINLEDIVGSEIQQICLGRYDVQFLFGSKRRICAQGLVEVLEKTHKVAEWTEGGNWSSVAFQSLLNATIESYRVPNERLLEIRFSGGFALLLHDSSERFETVQIYPEIIVV